MHAPRRDKEREERIAMEIIVDCYNELEAWLGWWHHLAGHAPTKHRVGNREIFAGMIKYQSGPLRLNSSGIRHRRTRCCKP